MSPVAGFTREGRLERDGDGGDREPGGPTVPENGGRGA